MFVEFNIVITSSSSYVSEPQINGCLLLLLAKAINKYSQTADLFLSNTYIMISIANIN